MSTFDPTPDRPHERHSAEAAGASEPEPIDQIADALARLRRPIEGGGRSAMRGGDRTGGRGGDWSGERGEPHRGDRFGERRDGNGEHRDGNGEHRDGFGERGGGHRRGRGAHGGPALWRMLSLLSTAEQPLGVSEVAQEIGVDQPRASRLIAQGVEMGLVARELDPADARRTRIALTEDGRERATRLRHSHSEAVAQALEGFSAEERRQLAELLGRFATAWQSARR